MSWRPAKDADCAQAKGCPPVDLVIVPRSRDIGGFEVRRVRVGLRIDRYRTQT